MADHSTLFFEKTGESNIGLTKETPVRSPLGNDGCVAFVCRTTHGMFRKEFQGEYIACERDEYINVNLQQV